MDTRGVGHLHGERLKEGGRSPLETEPLETSRQKACQAMDSPGNGSQAFWAVISRIRHGHIRQKRLSRAYIRGRLLAPDVLFTGSERQPQRRPSS